MYRLVVVFSLFIRNFYLPNPFEELEMGVLINWAAGFVLYPVTFFIVGLFYRRGSAPALGSLLYLFFYAVHTGLIMLCSIFNFATIAIVIISILYVLVLVGLVALKNKLVWGWYY